MRDGTDVVAQLMATLRETISLTIASRYSALTVCQDIESRLATGG